MTWLYWYYWSIIFLQCNISSSLILSFKWARNIDFSYLYPIFTFKINLNNLSKTEHSNFKWRQFLQITLMPNHIKVICHYAAFTMKISHLKDHPNCCFSYCISWIIKILPIFLCIHLFQLLLKKAPCDNKLTTVLLIQNSEQFPK